MPKQSHYDQVAQEIKAQQIDEGLWTRALAESGGDIERARAGYIRLRAEALAASDSSFSPLTFLGWLGVIIAIGAVVYFATRDNPSKPGHYGYKPPATQLLASSPRPAIKPPAAPPQLILAPLEMWPTEPLPQTGYRGKFAMLTLSTTTTAPLKVAVASGDRHYWLKLKATEKKWTEFLFIRAGETASVKVPLGTYRITYALGSTWHGEFGAFGSATTYHRLDGEFEFSQSGDHVYGHTLELYAQKNGNLETETINASEF